MATISSAVYNTALWLCAEMYLMFLCKSVSESICSHRDVNITPSAKPRTKENCASPCMSVRHQEPALSRQNISSLDWPE